MKHKINTYGFAHYLVLLGITGILVIGGVYALVIRASNNKNAKLNATTTASNSSKVNNASSNAQPLKSEAVVQTGTPPSSSSTKSTTQSPAKTSTASSKPSSNTTSPSAPSTPAAPSQTPLSALTAVISSLKSGGTANVTASDVDVPAAVSGNVKARPIVFTVNGTTYLAYTRVNPPNFGTSADTAANTMAIVQASGSTSLVQAHLDKNDNLVDIDLKLVGYTPSSN